MDSGAETLAAVYGASVEKSFNKRWFAFLVQGLCSSVMLLIQRRALLCFVRGWVLRVYKWKRTGGLQAEASASMDWDGIGSGSECCVEQTAFDNHEERCPLTVLDV